MSAEVELPSPLPWVIDLTRSVKRNAEVANYVSLSRILPRKPCSRGPRQKPQPPGKKCHENEIHGRAIRVQCVVSKDSARKSNRITKFDLVWEKLTAVLNLSVMECRYRICEVSVEKCMRTESMENCVRTEAHQNDFLDRKISQ